MVAVSKCKISDGAHILLSESVKLTLEEGFELEIDFNLFDFRCDSS